MENSVKNSDNLTVNALDIVLLYLSLDCETIIECPPTPRLKIIDLVLEYEKQATTTPREENNKFVDEEILLFRGQDYTTESVDCGESGCLGLGIAVF